MSPDALVSPQQGVNFSSVSLSLSLSPSLSDALVSPQQGAASPPPPQRGDERGAPFDAQQQQAPHLTPEAAYRKPPFKSDLFGRYSVKNVEYKDLKM